jgi:hypothetical protein
MIDITGSDISELNDEDLRSLIGLLCESELHANGFPTVGVTWGGDQKAKDGGVDVHVEPTNILNDDSFIPRSKTIFQVKRMEMPPNEIIHEMKPKGELRQVIKELADSRGAYIIVSSKDSTSYISLERRIVAMQNAISDYSNGSNLKVDFYDQGRIATWVRSHPALVIWVREKIGKPIHGWTPYENWANCPGGIKEEYMLDGHIRLYNSMTDQSEGYSAVDGLNKLRRVLAIPRSSVRLVGLSGVGKTRLLQALFDNRIGDEPLHKTQVIYTDMSYGPNPKPLHFTRQIISLKKPAILVVDNCPPNLHKSLTSLCKESSSLISLITVEYDIRDHLPEETEVFRLEPASIELIEKVICARFSHISKVDARTIAEFSGGNARIAIALANTIKLGEANLKDEELFDRLFHQRYDHDKNLLKVAKVCSLVYSFDSKSLDDDSELMIFSLLISMDAHEIYQNISELLRRDLVQQRSIWKAVLPHAIANKLAKRALEDMPVDSICNLFEKSSVRLLKSFSRRLSYLHDSDAAIEISERWLSKDGLLGDITHLNELRIHLLTNIAPVNPDLVLSVIRKSSMGETAHEFFSRKNMYHSQITTLLRSLAYDKDLFDRATELLCRFALSEDPKENNNSIRGLLKSLFQIQLSGTHATPEQRLRIIKRLIESNDKDHFNLGINLLDSTLKTENFTSSYPFEFGSRSRDYGFSPQNKNETCHWYNLFIEYAVALVVSDSSKSSKVKKLLAENFRGLWRMGMFDELEIAVREIANKVSWEEGWVAIKSTKRIYEKSMSSKLHSRLDKLEAIVKPTTLLEQAKLHVFVRGNVLDILGEFDEQESKTKYSKVRLSTRSIGSEVGSNQIVFEELLPDLISNPEGVRLFHFGQGLADGCSDLRKMWDEFRAQLSQFEESKRNYQVLSGFLNGVFEKKPSFLDEFLDEAVTDEILSPVFPWLQASVLINRKGVDRLKYSLDIGKSPISQYTHLADGRAHETINDADLCDLLKIISSKPNGIQVSIKILAMRLFNKESVPSDIIVSIGQELILNYPFTRKENNLTEMDYELTSIIEACFVNDSAKDNAKDLCNKLVQAYTNHDLYSLDYRGVLNSLAKIQPEAFLDAFLEKNSELSYWITHMFKRDIDIEPNPLSHIDDQLIINWCEENPEIRYPKVASAIIPFQSRDQESILKWTSLALNIIDRHTNPIVVLNEFRSSLRPMSWWGSLAEMMQNRLSLISELKNHHKDLVVKWALEEERKFEEEIRLEREAELNRERQQNERFE